MNGFNGFNKGDQPSRRAAAWSLSCLAFSAAAPIASPSDIRRAPTDLIERLQNRQASNGPRVTICAPHPGDLSIPQGYDLESNIPSQIRNLDLLSKIQAMTEFLLQRKVQSAPFHAQYEYGNPRTYVENIEHTEHPLNQSFSFITTHSWRKCTW